MTGLVIDNFAGGGGASTGIEAALGRPIDVAINHDPEAVAMHAANHPATRHYCQSVWKADPLEVTGGAPVALAWFSPDCKHFSKAKGGKPVEKRIRDLAWVVVMWAQRVRPAVIMLENVEEFRTWGPLTAEGMPCPERKGQTFDAWCRELRKCGYKVEWRELRASDFGAPTSRKRLFLIARSDGRRIVWPKPTHGPGRALAWRTAAEVIDWSISCPSIFERARALKDATCRRIATGIQRFVIDAAEPFIVPVTHHGSDGRIYGLGDPIPTVTAAKRGEMALVAATMVQMGDGEREGQAPRVPGLAKPIGTVVVGGGKFAVVAAFMAQHNAGNGAAPRSMDAPLSTITSRGTQQNLVTSNLVKLRGTSRHGQPVDEPLGTVTGGGTHFAEVRAFLTKYYGSAEHGQPVDRPLDAVTAKDRFGLVTVTIADEEYAIADIGMRMLTARELFAAQGFPSTYIIDPLIDGKPLTKTAQIRMCGNSVCPPLAEALVRANFAEKIGAAVAA